MGRTAKWNGLGQPIPLVQQNYIKKIDGIGEMLWFWMKHWIMTWLCIGAITNLTESWVDCACEVMLADGIYGRYIYIPGVPKKSTPVWFVITSKQVKLLKRNNLYQIEEGLT
jgi:hypothetical protein